MEKTTPRLSLRESILYFPERITYHDIPELEENWRQLENQPISQWNFSATREMDSAGIAWLEHRQDIRHQNDRTPIQALSPELEQLWQTFRAPVRELNDLSEESPDPDDRKSGWKTMTSGLERVGDRCQAIGGVMREFGSLISDIVYWSGLAMLGRNQHRRGSVIHQAVLIGVEALPIIGLMSGLVGLILALQSAAQLRQFGADIYIANLIGIAMIREMGPLMTAIMLAGRSASSFASEIATMVVTEEMDALKIMAIQPIRFVVVPKMLAISMVTPLLTVFSNALGILGGFLVAILYLEIPAGAFASQLIQSIQVQDILIGEFKSLVFAWIILSIGAYAGFKVHGGSQGVGLVTTQAVVSSIFAIILADSMFSLVFYF
ncbi:MAG: ABC transporter permease [Candidatus Delongbacteria bacterium]|nr:ABC transporter permease [Candidatus Delongbacteria bacterium]